MPFNFTKLEIEGLYIIEPKVFGDTRGYFYESYNKTDFYNAGINIQFIQDNQSFSSKGVLRGLHFQKKYAQDKLVRVISGEVYDVAVDIRNDSPTFGKHYGLILSAENNKQFLIPKGFAHGFCVLSETAIFSYKCSDFYHPEEEDGIIYNDTTFNINWHLEKNKYNVSEKDLKLSEFNLNNKYYSMQGEWL